MDGSIVLGSSQRKRLLAMYRKESVHPQVRLRAHIILLLSEGRAWSLIAAVLFCSTATIARWKTRFESGGVEALRDERRSHKATRLVGWAVVLVQWVTTLTPRDFGYCRSRWCCATRPCLASKRSNWSISFATARLLRDSSCCWRRVSVRETSRVASGWGWHPI